VRALAFGALAGVATLAIGLDGGASPAPSQPVTIETPSGEQAAGFVLAPGRVVTVAHVVEAGAFLRVQTNDHQVRRARVLRVDRRADLALLAVPRLAAAGRVRVAPAAAGSTLRVLLDGGAHTVTVRRAIDIRLRTATGRGRVRQRAGLELDASVTRGDSGAALVTAGGEVAGVVFARSSNRPDTAYAVDASELRRFLR
jgi:S1-C subfamily serine protease